MSGVTKRSSLFHVTSGTADFRPSRDQRHDKVTKRPGTASRDAVLHKGGTKMTNRRMDEIIRHQHPVTMPATASIREACAEMHKHRIGAVLVTDAKGSLAGIFTGRDLVRIVAAGKDVGTTTLHSAMTAKPHTMPPGHH